MTDYSNFSSLPVEEEQHFVVYERHSREAGKKARTLGLAVATSVLVLIVGIVFSFEKVKPVHPEEEALGAEAPASPAAAAAPAVPAAAAPEAAAAAPAAAGTPAAAGETAAPAAAEPAAAGSAAAAPAGAAGAPPPPKGATKAPPTSLVR
jgi:hypothetical protein